MRLFPNLALRHRLTLIIVATSTVALLLTGAGFIGYEQYAFKQELKDDVAVTAQMIGYNSTSALSFSDPKSAEETLQGLKLHPHIVAACIYDQNGRVFATYPRTQDFGSFGPLRSGESEIFGPDRLELFRPIVLAGETVGTVYLKSDLRHMRERLRRYASIIAAVMMLAIGVAYLVAVNLQRAISAPVSELAAIVSQVATDKNYSVRAVKQSNDELGRLIEGFNEMLDEIQARDSALQRAHGELEGRVEERTTALRQEVLERKTAEESLRLLSSAVEQSRESIMITDAQLDQPGPRIVFVNPAFTHTTGYSAEEVHGKTPRLLQGPNTDRAVLARLRENLASGEAFHGEAINYRKDGSEFHLEWQIAPIRNAAGEVTHFVGIQRDISERKQAEARLADTHRELLDTSRRAGMAEIATGVLHNVGNVLNSVNVSATLVTGHVSQSKASNVARLAALFDQHESDLAGFLSSDPRGQKIPAYLHTLAETIAAEKKATLSELDHLRKNIEHIKEIVATQQNYARTSAVTELVSIPDLIEDALHMNAGSFARHDIAFEREFEARPVLATDKHQVMQILINLVRNAKHACDDRSDGGGKRIVVRTTADEHHVRIAVCDNGVGIPPENLTRIFAHGFTTRKNGHGFGLHSGALAAKQLGGAITVHSDGPGFGATFTLELPFARKEVNGDLLSARS